MDKIEELKKLKELFDNGTISEEEFNMTKAKLLSVSEDTPKEEKNKKEYKLFKKAIEVIKKPKVIKIAVISFISLAVLFGAIFGISTGVNVMKTAARNAAVIEHIKPIMNNYDITDYTVGDITSDGMVIGCEVYAEGLEDLSYSEILELIKKLEGIYGLDDPCGGEKLSLNSVNLYPGKDAGYYYYRNTTLWSTSRYSNGKVPGLYSSYGYKCVYECDN